MRLRNAASTQCMHIWGLYKARAALGPQILHMPVFTRTPHSSTQSSVDATQPLRKAVLTNLTASCTCCSNLSSRPGPLLCGARVRRTTAFAQHSFGTTQFLHTIALTYTSVDKPPRAPHRTTCCSNPSSRPLPVYAERACDIQPHLRGTVLAPGSSYKPQLLHSSVALR